MNTQNAVDTGQQNDKSFSYQDGPRTGRPITGGASWWAQWFQQKNVSTPVAINDPPEHLPNYQPGQRLSIMQQRDANGDLADPWASVDHGALFGSFGHLPFPRRRLPIERDPLPGVAPPPQPKGGGAYGPGAGSTTPLPRIDPWRPIVHDPANNDGSSSDPTTNLEQQIVQQMGNTAPLGGIGATVPVEQQTIGGGGGSNALPVLALLAVAVGAIAFLYLHNKKKAKPEDNAVPSA